MQPILIIGGTGNIGRQVIAQLTAAEAAPVRALVRNPAAAVAHLPPQVELAPGDLTKPETLGASLAGVETVFLVWTAPAHAVRPAIEAIASRAKRIVFLSAPLKTPHPFFQQPNSSRTLAEAIERAIESSGLERTHLRPGMFALNSRHFWGPQIRTSDLVQWPYLEAPTAPIDERDIAAVAVRTLPEGSAHAGQEYVITGPESLSQREQIAIIGEVLGRTLRIEEVSRDEARRGCMAGMPPPAVDKLLDAWAAALGLTAFVTNTVRELKGKQAFTFREWVKENTASFHCSASL